MLPHDYTVSDAPSQGRAQGESVGKRRRNGEISLPPSSPGSGMRVFHLSVASRSLRNDPLGGARSFLYNKGEPQGGGAPHGSRIASAVWVYLWRSFPLRVRSALLITRNSSMTRVANSKSKITNEAIPKTVMVITSVHLEYERERHQAAGPNPYL